VIAAEGEQKASRALREASATIAESSSALQLRYLQVHAYIISLSVILHRFDPTPLNFNCILGLNPGLVQHCINININIFLTSKYVLAILVDEI
jgi:hypothetical protein